MVMEHFIMPGNTFVMHIYLWSLFFPHWNPILNIIMYLISFVEKPDIYYCSVSAVMAAAVPNFRRAT